MAKRYVVGGTAYDFPDDFTDQQAQDVLTKQGVIKDTRSVPAKVGSAIWTGLQRASAGQDVQGNPLWGPNVKPLDLGPIGYGAPAPERIADALQVIKESGGLWSLVGKSAAKGTAQAGAGFGLMKFGHPFMGMGMVIKGLAGGAGDAAKTLWEAFKATGGGDTAQEFETWLANQDREPLWKKAGTTGQTAPSPSTLPPTPRVGQTPNLSSGRVPGSFATQQPMPSPAPPSPLPEAPPGVDSAAYSQLPPNIQEAIQKRAAMRAGGVGYTPPPQPSAAPTSALPPKPEIPNYMQGPEPTPEEMANRSNLAQKIGGNLHQKGISSQDMASLAGDDPRWGNPAITSASKQKRYAGPSQMTRDMILDHMRKLEQQKFNDVLQPSTLPLEPQP